LEKVKQEDANTSRLAPDNVGGSEGELEMEEDGNK
jgi:hypothetical protein